MLADARQKFLVNFWNTGKGMIALGILSAVYFGIFGAVWAVTGEMTRWGGEFLELFGMDLSSYSYYTKQNLNGTPLTRTDGLMLIGMFIGALVAALWANKVKFRLPASKIRIFQAIVGGLLSGFGARLLTMAKFSKKSCLESAPLDSLDSAKPTEPALIPKDFLIFSLVCS